MILASRYLPHDRLAKLFIPRGIKAFPLPSILAEALDPGLAIKFTHLLAGAGLIGMVDRGGLLREHVGHVGRVSH